MQYKNVFIFLVVMVFFSVSVMANNSTTYSDSCTDYHYLYKPTGNFSVGFQDFEWMNDHDCPDLTATIAGKNYYDKNNKKGCRRIVVRVYYPSKTHIHVCSNYPNYVTDEIKSSIQQIKTHVLKREIHNISINLLKLGLPAKRGLNIAQGKFPALVFSPGARDNFKTYSSLLINLASHGYIIVAINSPFLTDVKFPDGQIVKQNPNLSIRQIYMTKYLDLDFVCQKLPVENQGVFRHMDLGRLGVFGHSAGGSAAIALVRSHPSHIKAAVAWDAPNTIAWKKNPNLPAIFNVLKNFNLPVMQLHSSYAKMFLGAADDQYKLSPNEFLIRIAPNYKNIGYFRHMDFTDYALFKSTTWMQPLNNYYQRNKEDNPVFPSLLLGTVSGKTAIRTVSDYSLAFFNSYLLESKNQSLAKCKPLVPNTLMRCG